MQQYVAEIIREDKRVSILTRPEGRVQLVLKQLGVNVDGFNPHPSRGTGATEQLGVFNLALHGFNPHPSRGTGATFLRKLV